MFKARSALASYQQATDTDPTAPVRLREIKGWHLAHLTACRAQLHQFRQHLAMAFGAEPPTVLYRGLDHDRSHLVRLTREQYWWIDSTDTGLQRFAAQLPSSAGAVTMLSDGRVRLRLEGPAARRVLEHGIAIDLHPDAFVVGRSAQTGLHHTSVFIERVAADAYELFVPRTFAATIWEYLVDAALPYGAKRE